MVVLTELWVIGEQVVDENEDHVLSARTFG